MSKKVIFLFTPGPIGGAEKIVLHGVKALRDQGIHVELWVIRETRVTSVASAFLSEATRLNIEARVFDSSKIYDHALLKELNKEFLIAAPSIIHAHGFKATFYGKLSTPSKSKFIITHHGKTGHTLKVKIYEFIEDQIMKRSHAVIAVSAPMRRAMILSGVNQKNIHIVDNFMTSPIPINEERISGPVKLLFVGRLSPEKGCEVLIKAMKLLAPDDFKLTIVGDGVERQALEKLTQELSLQELVSFVGFQNTVSTYMAASTALVMPSYREGLPLTLIEATATGLPVVASNVGGIPDLVQDGKNGYLVSPGSAELLSKALNELRSNYKILKAESERIKVNVVKRYSPQTWAAETIKIYESVQSHS
jgi:glycosyltransferase involved in cell wall biosynthesis